MGEQIILVVNSVREWGTRKILPITIALFLYLFSIFNAVCRDSSEAHGARMESGGKIELTPGSYVVSDSDDDGIPDAAELRTYDDRESFRRWFTAIAEIQFYRL